MNSPDNKKRNKRASVGDDEDSDNQNEETFAQEYSGNFTQGSISGTEDSKIGMTPVRSPASFRMGSGYRPFDSTPINASQLLVMATPRSPMSVRSSAHGAGTPAISSQSQQSMRQNTPLSLPRGDMGRLRTTNTSAMLNFAPPGTPNSLAPETPRSTYSSRRSVAGTPMDDHSVIAAVDEDHLEESQQTNGDGARIWGTNINTETCVSVFTNFIRNYTCNSDFEPFYMKQLHIIHRTENFVLNLNCGHMFEFAGAKRLYRQLQSYPQEVIPLMDSVVNEEYCRLYGNELLQRIQVKTFGLKDVSRMRNLDPSHIDQLLCVKGMVVRCSPIIPDLKQAYFKCSICAHALDVLIDRGRIDEPAVCPECKRVGSMEIIHNRCLFMDKQLIRVQETPDEIPEGETPHTVSLFAFDDLVDTVRPGDRIEITGIFRAVPRRTNPRLRTVRALYRTYIDTVHFRRAGQNDDTMVTLGETDAVSSGRNNTGGGGNDSGEETMNIDSLGNNIFDVKQKQFGPEKVLEFQTFARQGNVYNRLLNSFAPSIWELDDVKKGVLCQLFGGTSQHVPPASTVNHEEINNENNSGKETPKDATSSHQRGDINILLCGDPGTSKSQLLSYVHKLTPRGIYTSGKGSSAVGLTASVVRDPETRSLVLESGALVLSDNGICCIDEFDKMNDSTRAVLHEAMEQQTVSITKAGILATLNARTSILASANPVESRYNARLSVVENIKLPPTLLSRFDLIYLILDKPNPDSDRRLAKHLVSLYHSADESSGDFRASAVVSQEFLKEYIMYARYAIAPEISPEAVEALVQGYLSMRAIGGRGVKTISATPRQLESLIRISQALSKMRLADTVLESDVTEAIRLMRVATQAAATDPRTGTIDMDMITTGRTALDKDLVIRLTEELKSFLSRKRGQRLTVGQIRQMMIRESSQSADGGGAGGNSMISSVTVNDLAEAVRELEGEQFLQFTEATQTVLVRGSNNNS